MGEKFFDLKWGVFVGACFTCHKFGHLASECPSFLHQLPPTALQQEPLQPRVASPRTTPDKKMDKGMKSAPNTGSQPTTLIKTKDKGKGKMIDNDILPQERWQSPKKPVVLKQRPLQSRHWDASSALPGQPSTSTDSVVSKA